MAVYYGLILVVCNNFYYFKYLYRGIMLLDARITFLYRHNGLFIFKFMQTLIAWLVINFTILKSLQINCYYLTILFSVVSQEWFSRQQLVMFVLFVNISLAIMFFKLLT